MRPPDTTARAVIAALLAVLGSAGIVPAAGDPAVSSSLLCALASGAPPPSGALAPAPEGCDCAGPATSCRMVELANDRRMALPLAPGTTRRVRIAPVAGDRLRFGVGVTAADPARIEVVVRLRDADGASLREWRHEVVRWGGWQDVEVDLAGLAADRVREFEIAVGDGPLAPPGAMAALASPRLVASPDPAPPGATARADAVGVVRNVVLYVIDTLRADHASTYGYGRPTTPHLDRLAREGTTFERAYAVGSWTRPAIASLFTGLRPASHRVGVDHGLGRWPRTIAERFHAAGWSTRAFVANAQIIPHSLGFDRGFERFLAFPGGEGAMLATTAEVNPHLLRELETSRDERLFVYVHTVDPHAPYDPPACYEGLFGDPDYGGTVGRRDTFKEYLRARTMSPADVARVRDLYDEEVRFQDEMLGTLLDRLAATGRDRDTVVVVVADHGEELGDHGGWEHGERAWEELLRVPLVVRWPGRPDLAGRRISEPVQIVDLLPTLLATVGLPPAPEARGRSLLPLVGLDAASASTSRAAPGRTPSEESAGDARPVTKPPVVTTELGDGWDLLSIQHDGWKLVRRRPRDGAPEDRLFHLASDPGERRDRAASNRRRLEGLARRLDEIVRDDERLAPMAAADASAEIPEETRRRLEELGYVVH